ncbi:hypothetical protein AVEN_95595-1 [Araneus ventricosus]|uniref:Integrase p58-like C-terminal domain-containing protein n=1 Tax=Araneus ventricosus TaxID=182803 RepID=A0A4Y2G003_ARAVE|nr:hypothetical protein AVEN_95595-1 [Araneus ventricosus]
MKNLEARLESVHAFVSERIKLASELMKTRYDSRATYHHFKDCDIVWMYIPKRRRGLISKLQENWEGPYTIVKKLNDVVYRAQRCRSTLSEKSSILIGQLHTGPPIIVLCIETAGMCSL